jgi:2-keto-4-pentenoate hydratase/2-oxohepta-3-ene-1,7-dioic acid hydratase in catechol pathway
MKLAKIEHQGRIAEAIVDGDRVLRVGPWQEGNGTAAGFAIERFEAPAPGESLALADVRLLPPIGPGAKIVCLGLNYRNHVEETLSDLPENPSLFIKLADTLVGHGEAILRPRVSTHFDFEGEIAVVIGKPARHVARAEALSHVFGYTIMMDGSVRDYQKHSPSAGKNFHRSSSLGPWIVTADEIPDPTLLSLATRLNGAEVQSTVASLMLYDIPTAIEYISRWTPLAPGDVIATGTPGGVGSRRTPPLWMKQGDRIEVEVSAVGTLANDIRDET